MEAFVKVAATLNKEDREKYVLNDIMSNYTNKSI